MKFYKSCKYYDCYFNCFGYDDDNECNECNDDYYPPCYMSKLNESGDNEDLVE